MNSEITKTALIASKGIISESPLTDLGATSSFSEIVAFANGFKEQFFKLASEGIVEAGGNSIYKYPEELREAYYEIYFFGPISDKIHADERSNWVKHSNSIKHDMLKELELRVESLRKSSAL